MVFFFFQAEDGIRDWSVTGVQTCALPIYRFDYVVCDAPAGLSEATRAILICSDLAIVPVQPTGADLRSSAAAIALIREAQQARESDRPRGVMYLSRAVGGTRLKNEAIDALSHIEDIPLLSTDRKSVV